MAEQKELRAQRHLTIIKLLKEKQVITVEELCRLFDVSPHTIRRDLNTLEEQNVLRRTQGGATVPVTRTLLTSIDNRKHEHTLEKKVIAHAAAALIQTHSTIIVDGGSTTLALMEDYRFDRNTTIITSALMIANSAKGHPDSTLIVSGGILLDTTETFVGPVTESFFSKINADMLFLGARGVSAEAGITNQDMQEAIVKQRMIEAASTVVLLADGSKFGRTAMSKVGGVEAVDRIITDWTADPDEISRIRARGVLVDVIENPNGGTGEKLPT